MGADLIISVIEIKKGKEPNWAKAQKVLDKLTEDEAASYVAHAKGISTSELEEEYTTDTSFLGIVKEAFHEVKDAWSGHYRSYNVINLSKTTILMTGDRNWGDPVSECDTLAIFATTFGKTAGFLNRRTYQGGLMNRQEVFTTVKNHLLKQGKKSEAQNPAHITPSCLYRGPDDTKCAVGCLIKDEFFHESMNNLACNDPQVLTALRASLGTEIDRDKGDIIFLRSLQRVHDTFEPEGWERQLSEVAKEYDLT